MQLSGTAAVLFDMDGTLVDSDAAVERSWISWASEYGVDPAAFLDSSHGFTSAHTVARVFPQFDAEQVAAAAARQLEFEYVDLADVVPTQGAHTLLALLRTLGLPWAVVTSADRRLAAARLGAAGIAPSTLVTCEDVPLGKPDPAGYLLAAKLLGVEPEHCLVVEDAQPGAEAGRAAGAGLVATLKGVPGELPIGSLAQLADLLAAAKIDPYL
ncbi:MAG TPA: HAD-IA family hydrolase [Actinocrinis sp.]|jgi:sugar-phosphatase